MQNQLSSHPPSNVTIRIEKVILCEGKLLAKPALCLEATWCASENDFSVVCPDLGIYVYSNCVPGLVKELHALIPILWDEYAAAPFRLDLRIRSDTICTRIHFAAPKSSTTG
jgi:hypothetical protein